MAAQLSKPWNLSHLDYAIVELHQELRAELQRRESEGA